MADRPTRLVVNCAAVGAKAYFDEAASWEAEADAAEAAGDARGATNMRKQAVTCRLAGREGLARAGLPVADDVEPVTIVELTDEEIADREASRLAYVERLRDEIANRADAILAETEWATTLPPGETADAWAAYRDAVAELPANVTDPSAVVWPDRPAPTTTATRPVRVSPSRP